MPSDRRALNVDSNLVVGYTTQDHLLLDLDKLDFWKAYRITLMIQRNYPDVGLALLVHSSAWHYHVVFDKRLSWERIVKIIEDLAALSVVEPNYARVRTFRRDLTLRVSPKHGVDRDRPAPSPVGFVGYTHFGTPQYGIWRYLRLLRIFKNLDDWSEVHERLEQ